MFNEWFDGADKKFMFMYYQNDVELWKFNVKTKGDKVNYKIIKNSKEVEEKEIEVKQSKCPNLTYRFYLIMIILGQEFKKLDVGNIQLIKDDGFEDEKQELIDEEKEKAMKQIAKEIVRQKEEDKQIQMEKEKMIKGSKEK